MTYEDAYELMCAMEHESETEREEREAVVWGAWVETDEEGVHRADVVACDIDMARAESQTLEAYRAWYYCPPSRKDFDY